MVGRPWGQVGWRRRRSSSIVEVPPAQDVIGFYRVTAHGFGNGFFRKPVAIDAATGFIQLVKDGSKQLGDGFRPNPRRLGVDDKTAVAKFRDPEPHFFEKRNLRAQTGCVLGGKFHGLWKQKFLRGNGALRQARHHLFKENAFVRRMLVHDEQSVCIHRHDVKIGNDTENGGGLR